MVLASSPDHLRSHLSCKQLEKYTGKNEVVDEYDAILLLLRCSCAQGLACNLSSSLATVCQGHKNELIND